MAKHHRLSEVLDKKKISGYEFAKRMKMDYSNSYRFYEDNYDPKVSMLKRWAAAVGVRVRDLIKE